MTRAGNLVGMFITRAAVPLKVTQEAPMARPMAVPSRVPLRMVAVLTGNTSKIGGNLMFSLV
jgi:hypothetical protein